MTCEKEYQSMMCCEFSELCTTPRHSFTAAAGADRRMSHGQQRRGLHRECAQDDERAPPQPETRSVPVMSKLALGNGLAEIDDTAEAKRLAAGR